MSKCKTKVEYATSIILISCIANTAFNSCFEINYKSVRLFMKY